MNHIDPRVVIASNPGAAGERGSRDLRHIKSRLPLRRDCEDTRAACEFFGSKMALPSHFRFSRVHLLQQTARSIRDFLVFPEINRGHSTPFAGSAGFAAVSDSLVAAFDRHEGNKREIPNDGKSEARSGNFTARSGNVSS